MKKTIVLGVSSSIAAFKSVQLTSDLLKLGYDVEVIMTPHATQLIQPLTFSALTQHKTYVDTFDRQVPYEIEHISLAHKAAAFIVAPATANI
ncbi:MAG: flavoprotein, partial [Oscillospiraceae bacterium]|nr:flavoprotein [Oscillospiraceae bacterium]